VAAVVIESTLSPEECADRLRAAVSPDRLLDFLPETKPVVGSVVGRWVRLRKRLWYQNSFQTILDGVLYDHAGGTRFEATGRMHWGVRIFMVIWFSIAGFGFIKAMGGWPEKWEQALLLPLGVALWASCRWLARHERTYLAAFVAEVIGDRPEERSGEAAVE
jgi:hypothetical protein